MTTVHIMKSASGAFVPATEADVELMRRFKAGRVVRAEVAEMRNGPYFRKWWVLVQFAFDLWSDRMPETEWRGIKVLPDPERFRKDITIQAGFFRPVWNIKGEMRVEAESLAWSSMTEERFDKLYSATINAILKILPGCGLTEDKLQDTVDTLLGEFA